MTAVSITVKAADTAPGPGPKGTICYSSTLVVPGATSALINCQGLGKFSSIAEIYDRGYRVTSSGFLPDPRPGFPPITYTIYLIIEERK